MNWDAISFDWNQVRAFLATAEEGTFSAAARALKTTQPTISRQISELEDQLGVTLVERSVKGPQLTDAGKKLLHHVRAMSDAASMISMAALGQSKEVSGKVRITASDMLAMSLIPKLLIPLRQKTPGIRPEILASNDVKDLLRREADIAVRQVRPEQPELIARHVGDLHTGIYGAQSYFDATGKPNNPRAAADHAFIGIPNNEGVLATLQNLGMPLSQENFVVTSDSGVVVFGCLKAGYGLSLLPVALCDPEPELERILPELPTPKIPIWLVTHRELGTSKRIRVVFDQLAYELGRIAA
ncbi:MAG: LysR family transcriptional regulator [Pseudomonadota bacterium]